METSFKQLREIVETFCTLRLIYRRDIWENWIICLIFTLSHFIAPTFEDFAQNGLQTLTLKDQPMLTITDFAIFAIA